MNTVLRATKVCTPQSERVLRILFVLIFLASLVGAVPVLPVFAEGSPDETVTEICYDVTLYAAEDTYIRYGTPTFNYGSAASIRVSPLADAPENALYRWDLTSIPTGADVTAASLTFNVTSPSVFNFRLYAMRRAWVEGTVNNEASTTSATWNTYDGTNPWGSPGAENTATDRYDTNLWDATASTFAPSGDLTIALNASGLSVLEGWISASASNFGFTVQRDLSNQQSGSSGDYWTKRSSEYSTAAQRPRLNVTYCEPGTPVQITVTPAAGQSKIYGASDPVLAYTSSDPSVSFTGALGRGAGEAVGSYPIQIGTLSAGPGYTIILSPANFTINPKPITVTAEAKSKIYGASDPAFTYTYPAGTLVGSDSFSGAPTRDPGENIGEYTINQGTLTAGANYTMSFVTAKLTITPKPITVTAEAKSKVYGAVDPSLTYTVPAGSLVTGDSFSGTLTRDPGVNVGEYTINQGTLTAGSNYTITFVTAKLTITPKPITVTAEAKSKVYGAVDPALSYTVPAGSLVTGDSFSGTIARDPGENVGEYTIQQHTLTAGTNYTITFVTAKLTINKRPITVTADNKSKLPGAADPSLTHQVTSGSLAFTDAFTGTLAREAGETVGTYRILQGTLALNSNYDLTYVEGTFTINPNVITVTVTPGLTKVYGSTDPVFTYTVSDPAVVFSGALTRAPGETAGAYAILLGTLSAGPDYSINFVPAPFNITKKDASVTPNAASKVLGDPDPVFTGTLTGFLPADNVTAVYTRTSGETVAGSPYTISATLSPVEVLVNYNITYHTAAFTIQPAVHKIVMPFITR